jgi:hypothetical protein
VREAEDVAQCCARRFGVGRVDQNVRTDECHERPLNLGP